MLLCRECIINDFASALPRIQKIHAASRKEYGLPPSPPRTPGGIECKICVNECVVGEGEYGYCGARSCVQGKFKGVSAEEGNVSYYYDPLPTNCVGDWVCPAGTGWGYPRYAYTKGPEFGYKNLAVFYHSCTFNCLFCQNWHYRRLTFSPRRLSAKALAAAVDRRTSCICYFGGDPASQMPHSLRTSEIARKMNRGRILRICWETNGSMHPALLKRMVEVSLESGGCVKFDLKCAHEELNIALAGITNRRSWENFERAARRFSERPEPPLLIASTLLVPGYVTAQEVYEIARRIAALSPMIPYSLLAFHPHFYMSDLPTTSREHAYEALRLAQDAGLRKVKIGNVHLLS